MFNDETAERSVLSAMLLDNAVIQTVMDRLMQDDFFYVRNQLVYQSIIGLHRVKAPADLVTVVENLRMSGNLEQAGGIAYISSLPGEVATAANVSHHAGVVKARSNSRRLMKAQGRFKTNIESGMQGPEAVASLLGELEGITTSTNRDPEHIGDSLGELFVGKKPHVPIGLEPLQNLKIVPGNVCVVGARPGAGKTALLGTLALYAAKTDWDCLFLSLEMPSAQIRQRLMAANSSIDLAVIQEANDPRLVSAARDLQAMNIWIMDATLRLDIETISSVVRKFVSSRPGRNTVVFIDYLQLITSNAKYEKRYELLGHVCRELKRLALSVNVPLVVAAQLSRAAENRGKDAKPQLSDLRESGEIEQTADQVLLVHREPDRAMVRVAKYRMGPVFTAELRFVGERCYFDDFGGWR